jgi:hypothetical protein
MYLFNTHKETYIKGATWNKISAKNLEVSFGSFDEKSK